MSGSDSPYESDAPGAVSEPPQPMFCLGCQQDLEGIALATEDGIGKGNCPECGRVFDPGTPSTFAKRRRSPLELLLLRRVAPCVSLTLLVFTLLWYGWIPRPVALFGRHAPAPDGVYFPEQSTLWMWAGSLYGSETVRMSRSVAEVWMWNDRVLRVEVFVPHSDGVAWEVHFEPSADEPGGGIWTMHLHRPVPLTHDLLTSFRFTRERILGLSVGLPDESVMVEPFEVTGSEAEILSAYIRASGITVTPIRSDRDQVSFWVFDQDLDRLIQVDEAELDRRGIAPVDRSSITIRGIIGSP